MIQVQTLIHAPVEKVWDSFTNPKHIVNWNNASVHWHCPKAENDLRVGGEFNYRLAAKDGNTDWTNNIVQYRLSPHCTICLYHRHLLPKAFGIRFIKYWHII